VRVREWSGDLSGLPLKQPCREAQCFAPELVAAALDQRAQLADRALVVESVAPVIRSLLEDGEVALFPDEIRQLVCGAGEALHARG
jgi:hypothetical protein